MHPRAVEGLTRKPGKGLEGKLIKEPGKSKSGLLIKRGSAQ
jgi:hypothetical protein